MSNSLITKKALSHALINLCLQKPFSKINIVDIANECGLKRQTFYYHFTDKYDLLSWTYKNDALHFLTEDIQLENWNQSVLKMLQKIQLKQSFYYHTVKFDQTILSSCFSTMTHTLFHELFEQLDQYKHLSMKDREFYARFFSYGCCGVLIAWISEEFMESAEEISNKLLRLAKDTQFLASRLYSQNSETCKKTS